MKKKTVAAVTLGCKVNSYDTESMLELFRNAGYETVGFDAAADIYIINTCSVTAEGDRKSRQAIRRAARKNPEAVIIAAGCFTQKNPGAEVGAHVVIGTDGAARARVVEAAERYMAEKNLPGDGIINCVSGYNNKKPEFYNLPAPGLSGRTRTFIKIQDGCENYCAYCIIPFTRGPSRSRPLDDILNEARLAADKGVKEAVLTGIAAASYGKDLEGEVTLTDVIHAVCGIPGIQRVRLSSLGPAAITGGFLEALRELPGICSHFHLSLQSGCNKTLERMNRKYTAARFIEALEDIRGIRPDAAITTDVIAGFPGESEADFLESYTFIKEAGFAALHVFPYSERPGTAAEKMQGTIDKAERNRRARIYTELGRELKAAFMGAFSGSVMDVLFENEVSPGVYRGLTSNYIEVRVSSDKDLSNMLLPVTLGSVRDEYINGFFIIDF